MNNYNKILICFVFVVCSAVLPTYAKLVAVYDQGIILISDIVDQTIVSGDNRYEVTSSEVLDKAQNYIDQKVRVLLFSMGEKVFISDIRLMEESPFVIHATPINKMKKGIK